MNTNDVLNKLIAEIERMREINRKAIIAEHIKADIFHGRAQAINHLFEFITSLQQEQKCIFGNTPSEDICSVCSAYCPLRVPKTKVSTSTEIAAPSGQAEDLTFEEYLRGVFEINNGIENDPDILVRIHAPKLLKLARKQEQPGVEFEVKFAEFLERKDAELGAKSWSEDDLRELALYFYYGRNDDKQPELDLEKEVSNYLKMHHLHIKDGGRVVFDNDDSPNFMFDIIDIARHFYELGQRTKYQQDRAEFAKLKAKEWQGGGI